MLPLAIPVYVLAFVTIGIVDFSGPLQTGLRDLGINIAIPSVRNVWGAGLVLSLAFYPYVYLLVHQAFLSQGRRAIEAGQMLGLGRGRVWTALLMGFVEVMKEMPVTLMTRRQGWDTLAVRMFEMTSEGMWGQAALSSLLIVLVGLLPIWMLLRQRD